jgi:hypothetical protein
MDHFKDLVVDGEKVLNVIQVALNTDRRKGCCEHGNEPSTSIKGLGIL